MRNFILALLTCGALSTSLAGELLKPTAASPDPVLISQGDPLYQQNCGACHGGNGTGGPGGAANLTQSSIATAPDDGRTLYAFLSTGRPDKGMPPMKVTQSQAAALSARLRAFVTNALAAAAPGTDPVLVGDASIGKAFFNGPVGKCFTCHAVVSGEASSASNLANVASRYKDARSLQNNMLLNRSFFWSPALGKDVTAILTYGDGRTLSGFLTSVSDFKVIIRDAQGIQTTIVRSKGEPRVALEDRMQHHLDMLEVYRDVDIHNLTAYLATLK
jgi:cytochrome c oxidase cbb3-type subunit III